MSEGIYITRFDSEPEFWQYLNGLTQEDLIAELIQNELDAEATHTRICFEADRFVCEGDGMPVDADGWIRLSFVRGAGKDAPRKRHRIGVKNHGLKTCFTLGDDIVIQSAGQRFEQTLYRDGDTNPPAPGTFREPIPDEMAPASGCRIIVRYRARPLVPTVGEGFTFSAPDETVIEAIFRKACADLPNRFLGVIRPSKRDRYTIELNHHTLGSATFEFRSTRAHKCRNAEWFTRTCKSHGELAPGTVREQALVFTAPVPVGLVHEIPSFYEAGSGFTAEIAWCINSKGSPISTVGHLRYPITYTGSSETARTGLGAHYSGPFVSDQERHGSSPAAFNAHIVEACDAALARFLRDHIVPKHGPRALSLLLDPINHDHRRLLGLTSRLLQERAIPLSIRKRRRIQFGPRRTGDGVQPVVVTSYSWATGKIVPALASLCPSELDQADARIPEEILEVLAGDGCAGWEQTHVTFDEADAIDRLQPNRTAYYPWPNEAAWRRGLANAATANHCLDILLAWSDNDAETIGDVAALRAKIYLPDSDGVARPMSDLFIGNELPAALRTFGMPPLLHPTVGRHALLRRRAWRLKAYTFDAFFEALGAQGLEPSKSEGLWQWFAKHWSRVPRRSLRKVGLLPIWPARDGVYRTLNDLCRPRNPKIAGILSKAIDLPTEDVLRIRLLRNRTRGSLSLRSAPSPEELMNFYSSRVSSFSPETPLNDDELARFHVFEEELVALAADKAIAQWLRQQSAFGLGRDRGLRLVSSMHRENARIARIRLLDRDIIDRKSFALDKLFPARTVPSLEATVRALQQDSIRTAALIPRLQAVAEAKRREQVHDSPVTDILCIPVDGRLFAPAQLAFKGNRGDYWGEWKVTLLGKGLSADDQQLYREAGVTGGEPNAETSLAFFTWLNGQSTSVLPRHLEMVIRHFAHREGVKKWWDVHPDVPCLPVEAGSELRLISRRRALRSNSRVFLPDFEELANAMRAEKASERVMLAIITHPDVTDPITEMLREAGVKSLRNAASAPTSVRGDSTVSVPLNLFAIVEDLRSSKMNNLRKRLAGLELPLKYLREHWHHRVTQVQGVSVATGVNASFRICGHNYRFETSYGFDEATGRIWLKQEADRDIQTTLFEALVERIFIERTPKFAAYVLQQAFRQQFHEASPIHIDTAPDEASENEPIEPSQETESAPGDTTQTHRPTAPDSAKNLPRPGPIPKTTAAPNGSTAQLASRNENGRQSHRQPAPDVEITHKADLKQNQYAWHCQACLATRSPRELAPEGSYVEFSHNRQAMIEAHHADQVHAFGARHAGNLIVLCHNHHHEFGNALSREQITIALRNGRNRKTINFVANDRAGEKALAVAGYIVSVRPAATGKTVKFFFTAAHRDHWLSMAAAGA
jgi:hypothetical protein